jgi:exopolysaccharide biosynthesis WecB/TagA/CpsF family protein
MDGAGTADLAPPKAVRFAGLTLTPMDTDEAVMRLARRDPAAPFAAFVTPNAEFAYFNRVNEEFRATLETAFISTNDSRILHRLGRFAGLELAFAPGAYVVSRLFEQVIAPDDPLTIIGANAAMVEALRQRYGLTRIAHHVPPMGFIHDHAAVSEAVDFVVAHPARFVFVAMGPPRSEILCRRIVARGGATGLGLCIGSSIGVVSREMEPAPDWMERSGLVWLHRLAREPRRLWKRYLVHAPVGAAMALSDIAALRLGLRAP